MKHEKDFLKFIDRSPYKKDYHEDNEGDRCMLESAWANCESAIREKLSVVLDVLQCEAPALVRIAKAISLVEVL